MDTQETKVFVVNVRSNFKSKLEPLGLSHRCIKHKAVNKEKPGFYDYTQTVFAAEKVPWIEKTIFIVEEAKMSYFLIQQSLSSRKVDLMRLDTE